MTETLLNGAGENARQISAVALVSFALATRAQVRPPPVTLVTVVGDEAPPAETNASSNSFDDAVEKVGEAIVAPGAESCETVTSTPRSLETDGARSNRG